MKNQYADNLNKTINNHNAMISYCYYDHQGRLQTKIEQYSGLQDRYTYLWNNENRLLSVRCNDLLQEEYLYNSKGLRIRQKRTANSGMQHTDGLLYYDKKGRLLQAGRTLYRYDGQGRLVEKQDANGLTRFVYQAGKNKIILPEGHEIVYEYSRNAPCKRLRDGIQSAYYTWQAHNRLDCLYDYDYGLLWNFTYHQKGWPSTAIVSILNTALPYLQIEDNKKREQLHGMISGCGGVMFLNCGCDHNGTLKVLTNEDGLLFMKSNMDSFGNIHDNGLASAPLGFMNGLVDRDTNLLLFGTKFYDPAIANIINISDKNKSITPAGVMAMDDNNWDESEHPRDKAGKFTAKGGGGSGKTAQTLDTGLPQTSRANHGMPGMGGQLSRAAYNQLTAYNRNRPEIQLAHVGEMRLWETGSGASERENKGQDTQQEDMGFYRSLGSRQADITNKLYELFSSSGSNEDSEKQFATLLDELKELDKTKSGYHSPSSEGLREAEEAYNSNFKSRGASVSNSLEKYALPAIAGFGGADFGHVAAQAGTLDTQDIVFQGLISSLVSTGKRLTLQQAKTLVNDLTIIHKYSSEVDTQVYPFTSHPSTNLGAPYMIEDFVHRAVRNEDSWNQLVKILDKDDHYKQLKAWIMENNL